MRWKAIPSSCPGAAVRAIGTSAETAGDDRDQLSRRQAELHHGKHQGTPARLGHEAGRGAVPYARRRLALYRSLWRRAAKSISACITTFRADCWKNWWARYSAISPTPSSMALSTARRKYMAAGDGPIAVEVVYALPDTQIVDRAHSYAGDDGTAGDRAVGYSAASSANRPGLPEDRHFRQSGCAGCRAEGRGPHRDLPLADRGPQGRAPAAGQPENLSAARWPLRRRQLTCS